jgi:hypothetical protein
MAAIYYDHDDILLERSTFVRDRERIVIDRVGSMAVEITFSDAAPQLMKFDDPVSARLFLNNLECEFARDGWTLTECELGDRVGRRMDRPLQPRA